MRYVLSLSGGILAPAKDDFDRMLLSTIASMKRQGITEGSVALKLEIELEQQFPYDEDGNEQEVFVPHFDYAVSRQIVETDKTKGKVAGDFVLQMRDGVPMLFDRDSNTLFDVVEGGEPDGPDGAA